MAPPQWAYQVENYVNEPDEELICSICRAVFCDPVMCPCDHVFCRVCISKWLQNNRNCPICRKRASNSSVKQMVPIIKNLIMKLMLNCHNKSLGCPAQFSVENSEAHMKECEYEFVQCKNKPCKDRLFRKDITEHETSDCPHRYIKCKICGSKMPTSAVPEKHDCVRALQLRLRRKNNIIRKKNNRIKELRNENKTLKAASQNNSSDNFLRSRTSGTFSSLSPDEIMINIAEFDSLSSTYSSTDSDDSSENSILILTNSPLEHSDDNVESESFSGYLDNPDSIEYSRNESPHDATEYRNAESQTMDVNLALNDSHHGRSGNSPHESNIAEVPDSEFGQSEERLQSRRPVKRRPTSQKPAKRRFHPFSPSSSDDDNESKLSSLRSSKRCWRLSSTDEEGEAAGDSQGNSHMEAGPSSMAVENASAAAADTLNNKWNFRSKAKVDQKRARQATSSTSNDAVVESAVTIPSGSTPFSRTLSLLQWNNVTSDSDPEWLPEYASHRGDTTSETDSSFYLESSTSELSDSDTNNEDSLIRDNAGHDSTGVADFMQWICFSDRD